MKLQDTQMFIQPSENPGAHERHLLRRHNNPLFTETQTIVDQDSMFAAQERDHQAILEFHEEFQTVLDKTVNLKPTEDSDAVLKLKDRLDRLYERASVIADDQSEIKEAIKQLLAVIMSAIRLGAQDDPQAHKELDQEEVARAAHFTLLESSLVADLLDPHSPIHKDELIPTLLSADKNDLALAVQIFTEDQLTLIMHDAEKLISNLQSDTADIQTAKENLEFMLGYVEFINLQNAEN